MLDKGESFRSELGIVSRSRLRYLSGERPVGDNDAGRTLGGGSGFGMLGAALWQNSPYVGASFGYYGTAWCFVRLRWRTVRKCNLQRNAMVDIRSSARAEPPAKKARQTIPHRRRAICNFLPWERSFSGCLRRDRRHRREPSARRDSDAPCPAATLPAMTEAESAWEAGD
jgi:hypothetical protein